MYPGARECGDPAAAQRAGHSRRIFDQTTRQTTRSLIHAATPQGSSWKMSKRKVVERPEIHEGTGNVYRDLGFPDAEEMLVKARLVHKISEIIRSKGLTQVEAAKILGLTQPKLSGLLRGQFRGLGTEAN
jgi:predicted XRE-type DNA-binding protein